MNDPIIDGFKLMFIGMGTVVVFLFVMIWCMNLFHKLIAPVETMLDPKETPKKPVPSAPRAAADEAMLAAAAFALFKFAPGTSGHVAVDGRTFAVKTISADTVSVDGTLIHSGAAKAAPAAAAAPVAAAASSAVRWDVKAPLPGTVVKINVAVGDVVAAGTEVLLLEAMKMETPVCAEFAGRVVSIAAAEKESVAAEQVLIALERV